MPLPPSCLQILLVVAQGIIIDSFGQLRDENAEVTERLKGACFICGLERHVLDQYPGGMEAHIARDHHSWNYVDLFVLLQTTPRCRLTDLEEYVHDCVQHGDTSWIPSKQCLAATSEESKHDPQVLLGVGGVRDGFCGPNFQGPARGKGGSTTRCCPVVLHSSPALWGATGPDTPATAGAPQIPEPSVFKAPLSCHAVALLFGVRECIGTPNISTNV